MSAELKLGFSQFPSRGVAAKLLQSSYKKPFLNVRTQPCKQ